MTSSIATAAPRLLRPYQYEAAAAVLDAWATGTRRVGVVLPTGAGKSTVIAAIADHAAGLGLRVVMLAHRGELLEQMADAVAAVNPEREPVGIVRAARDEHSAVIVAATIQTLVKAKRRRSLGPRDVILWDEVHHIGADTYHDLLRELGGYADSYFCGFTATMRREDKRKLGEAIEAVVYERDLRWAIEQGFLTQPRGLTVRLDNLDLQDIRTVAGDFNQGELAEMMEAATDAVVDAIERHASDRRAIIFAASVEAAHVLAEGINASASGGTAEAVDGSMSLDQRAPIYARFRSGATQHLVTVSILTEGADFPMCDAVVIARPTKSQTLYSQMVGRALRLFPGKTDALVLDLAGTTRVLKLVTLTDLDGQAPHETVDEDGDPIDAEIELEVDKPEPVVKPQRVGPQQFEVIDLFGGSVSATWLQSLGGVPFLDPHGNDRFVFLWPVGDMWRPGTMTAKGAKAGEWLADASDLDTARENAESWVVDEYGRLPETSAPWRRNPYPSEAQVRFARSLGIPDAEDKTKARLSDDITIALTSRRLDTPKVANA